MAASDPISALTALGGAPATGDLLVTVDVSDSTQSANGTTKKMTVANLFTAPTFTGTTTAAAVNATAVTVAASSAAVTVNATSGDPSLTFKKAGTQTAAWNSDAASTMKLLDNGGSTIATFQPGGSLALLSGLTLNTDKLTVAGSTGNTAIAGTLAVTGNVTTSGGVTSSAPTGNGVGYATGAGGAVTQVTPNVTAVTINKLTGTITMAAGTFPAQNIVQFTVNNSTVAATDTVIVSIKSGWVDDIVAAVTAVAAGSFQVSIANVSNVISSSTTPVLNFAVIKAVAS